MTWYKPKNAKEARKMIRQTFPQVYDNETLRLMPYKQAYAILAKHREKHYAKKVG